MLIAAGLEWSLLMSCYYPRAHPWERIFKEFPSEKTA